MIKSKRFFNKILIICITVFCLLFLFLGSVLLYKIIITNKLNFTYLSNSAKRIVLFIGDGMGENHIKNTETKFNTDCYFRSFDNYGWVTTFSNTLFSPTDSAAAATALATGKKVNNGEISYSYNSNIQTISEYAKNKSIGVGIVTTDNLYGATPAGFSSHAKNRSNTSEIINSQLESNIDIFLGCGTSTYNQFSQKIIDNNYTHITDFSNLTISNNKILGTFNSIANFEFFNTSPTLSTLTTFAINYLDYNYPNGYFLMVESAHIDKTSHSNNIDEMCNYLFEFNNSIKTAHNLIKSKPNYSLFVTADHETGDLNYTSSPELITNALFLKTSHTSKNVPYFMQSSFDCKIPTRIDNTDIFKICKAMLSN